MNEQSNRKGLATVAALLATVGWLTATPTVSLGQEKSAGGKPPTTMLLWPDRADGSNGAPGAAGESAGDKPTMRIYHVSDAASAPKSEGPVPAVVVVPGGGYGGLADGHEGTEIANWFNDLGASAFVCLYRHRNTGEGYGYPYPIMDAQRAIALVRANAEAWNVDPERVGVIGFSAGGHLVTSLSTTESLIPPSEDPINRQSVRPDFAIVCYPVIALGRPFTHRGSQRNLLGENVPQERLDELSTDRRVSEQTPPTFLWHTAEDPVVPVENALVYYQALVKHGVPSQLHVFELGRHGLGLAKPRSGEAALPASAWPSLCVNWLRQHGFLDAIESK